ncbi:Focadhesin/RST, DUF3730 [Dillenia turbinata]|uniref:Focadhesin/RST, DUF3730 n=1 Tax=Dillenia turbinata TaxID=194707 RepID=A0AAN8ZAL9_9MAGN
MESYTPLLERLKVPQPSLQKFAVISIFEKLRSSPPPHLDLDSDAGRHAISQCLNSKSPAIIDQSVREWCRLVVDSKMDISRGLLELQSSLEGTESRFVNVFVKGLGFLVRLGFRKNLSAFRFESSDTHPFILLCREEVQSELVQQVILFIVQNKHFGIDKICEFLRPFLNFSILRVSFTVSSLPFMRNLISSMASLCCSIPAEAISLLKLQIEGLKYFPCKENEDARVFVCSIEDLSEAYIVILKHLVEVGKMVHEARTCGLQLLETILLPCINLHRHSAMSEAVVELVRSVLMVQKELGLPYMPEFASATASLFIALVQSDIEHEQLSILKVLLLIFQWKSENVKGHSKDGCEIFEELLLILPAINLMSSPSKSVKAVATDLLYIVEGLYLNLLSSRREVVAMPRSFLSISKPNTIILRLLRCLFFEESLSFGPLFLNFHSAGKSGTQELNNGARLWLCQLKEYSIEIAERKRSLIPISESQEIFLSEMPLLVSSFAAVLVMHRSSGSFALDSLAAIGRMDPRMDVPLLLAILYYTNIYSRGSIEAHNMSLKLLGVLPSLATNSVMIPLVLQTILPMVQKDAKPVLHATATRLLCKTWEINDRVFGSLQGLLLPKGFTEFKSEKSICLSMAVSIRDVCRKNPDRGVDLILSVAACIESRDPTLQAIGLQSLAHLCEADVIDFYTAWDVIGKHVLDYSTDNTVAHGISTLLRWGALDAEAYPESSGVVLKILWDIASCRHLSNKVLWVKAQVSAFEALSYYEVSQIENSILDFKRENIDLLTSEHNPDVLKAMEAFEGKIVTFEYNTRRRVIKEKRVTKNKIEKLLDVFPQAIFSSGKSSTPTDLPGAALLCLSFTPKDVKKGGAQGLLSIHSMYENALVEIAATLDLSKNIVFALLSVQSWKPFMQRWLRGYMMCLGAEGPSSVSEKTSKAANDILKSMKRVVEESTPRSAENIALAIGALCLILPQSAHSVKFSASKFLLSWLFQHEHEYHQWSAAISLGLVSSSLHVTDRKQKFQNITGLLEVACCSKSTLVKGSCAAGLGFACQDLLKRVEAVDSSHLDGENQYVQEAGLIGKIVRVLSLMLSQLTESSFDILQCLSECTQLGTDDMTTDGTSEFFYEKCNDLEEDAWNVTGLVLGLGYSIGALYRAGAHDVLLKIKNLIMSWIPHVNRKSSSCEKSVSVLSVGSCLVLPTVVSFCRRVELMADNELNHLVNGYLALMSELVSVKKTGAVHQSLLTASCIGTGNLIACILDEGVYPIESDALKAFLELCQKSYTDPYPPIVHWGGMLGIVNALGAGAGALFHEYHHMSLQTGYEAKDSSYIVGPLFSSPLCEPHLQSMVQEIFLVSQNSKDRQNQHYAAWALSFLRHHLWSKELYSDDHSSESASIGSKPSQSLPEDSTATRLSLWLMHLNYQKKDAMPHVCTVAAVLRCLSRAPRLPALEWGPIIRRCMSYEGHVSSSKEVSLREECLEFSIAHATRFDPLLSLLDDLCDLSRLKTLELHLQLYVLFHLADLIKIFSSTRLEKLFDDVAYFFSSLASYPGCDPDKECLLRVSCWKGLHLCFDDSTLDAVYISNIESCMKVLFSLLPVLNASTISSVVGVNSAEEWSQAVKCLGKARRSWLLDVLQVSEVNILLEDNHFIEAIKRIKATARLVLSHSIPFSELEKLKVLILNANSCGIWHVLVEVISALQHADGNVKRRWLMAAVEICCMTKYPSTALQFIGLLSGCCSRYMPLLLLEPSAVLSDLPVTLPSLLSNPSWKTVADSVASHLFMVMERLYCWSMDSAHNNHTPAFQPVDKSENDRLLFLTQVVHEACAALINYLPLEKQESHREALKAVKGKSGQRSMLCE